MHDYGFEGGIKNLTFIHGAYFKDSYVGKKNIVEDKFFGKKFR